MAAGIGKVAYEPTGTNKADILTKTHSGPARVRIIQGILF